MDPPLDFQTNADDGHPVAGAVGWSFFSKGQEARLGLDLLHVSLVDGALIPVSEASLDWWAQATNLQKIEPTKPKEKLWPAVAPGPTVTSWIQRTPNAPYMDSTTVWPPGSSGFDEFDLEAALRAQSVVRNAKDAAVVDLPLFLALLDREGYRSYAFIERTGRPKDFSFPPSPDSAMAVAPPSWFTFPFGIDILGKSPAKFNEMVKDYVAKGILAADVFPWVNEKYASRYIGNRLWAQWMSAASGVLRRRTLTRTAHWLGIALQQATFQWFHWNLKNGAGGYVEVDEFASPDLPTRGSDANSLERRRYLAYYALVYLAFNAGPHAWNKWVQAVPQADIDAGGRVSELLLYHRNSHPEAIEPGASGGRLLGQRGNMLRFAASLDAYLRMNNGGVSHDATNPLTGRGAW
jgi:hypothetical protein